MPWCHIMRQSASKDPIEFVLSWPSRLGMGLPLKVVCFPVRLPWRTLIFLSANGYWLERDSWWRHVSAFTHVTVSVSSYVCILLSLKGLDSIPSGSYVLSSLFKEFCPEERDLLRDFFGPECSSVFHSLHIVCLWVSVFVHICCRKKSCSDNGWARHMDLWV